LLFYTYFNTLYINSFITILNKIVFRQRLVSFLTNSKKLIKLQRTIQFSVKSANKDVYNIAFDSNSSKAINKDNFFCLYIVCKTNKILNTASDKNCTKNTEL
jgi:hypothetical protein